MKRIEKLVLRTSSLNEKDSTIITFKIPDDVDIDMEQVERFTDINRVFYVLCKLLKLEEIKKDNSTDGNS